MYPRYSLVLMVTHDCKASHSSTGLVRADSTGRWISGRIGTRMTWIDSAPPALVPLMLAHLQPVETIPKWGKDVGRAIVAGAAGGFARAPRKSHARWVAALLLTIPLKSSAAPG